MIINELVAENFGVFRGTQEVRLTPPDKERPVILIGGLNGSGKTTLMEALQLALFGKLAAPARDAEGGYDSYLRRSIHRDAPTQEGARVEVTFESVGEGRCHQYRVSRFWAPKGRSVKEQLEVYVDGIPDPGLAETWADQVHRFLPPQLAPLFLFDGERIESLANPSQAKEFLTVAIDALLGMDLVRQVQQDLLVVERRKREEALSQDAREKLEKEQENLDAIKDELAKKQKQTDRIRDSVDKLRDKLAAIEEEFESDGGHLLEARDKLDEHRSALKEERASHQQLLREFAAGALPLFLIKDQLLQVQQKAELDKQAQDARQAVDILISHKEELVNRLKDLADAREIRSTLESYVSEVANAAKAQEGHTNVSVLGLSDKGRVQTHQLLEDGVLDGELRRVKDTLSDLGAADEKLDQVEQQLAAVPEKDSIARLMERRNWLSSELDKTKDDLEAVLGEIHELEQKKIRQDERIERFLKDATDESFSEEKRERVLHHSEWARSTLEKFRERAIEKNIEKIEDNILDCYKRLLRKQGLIHQVHINPFTYEVSLFGRHGGEISTSRLSAGERQLLAVAILWGLGKTSGRPLPVIVDTPLGRLDSHHRAHLINRYFPEASHQVILLSTDEEIVGDHLDNLKDVVGCSYELSYDDEEASSDIFCGYFRGAVTA